MKNLSTKICVLTFLLFSNFIIAQQTVYCVATGNWNSPAIWSGGEIPLAYENVEIVDGYIVTINDNVECLNLTVGGGGNKTNSTLEFGGNYVLTVHGTLKLGGTGVRSGTIDMSLGGTLACNSLATGNTNSAFWLPGNGTVELTETNTLPSKIFTTFNNLTISNGTLTLNSDIVVLGDWTYSSTATSIGGSGNVTLAGDFTNSNSLFDDTDITFTFNGSGNQTITSLSSPANARSTFGTLIVDKSGGTLYLGSDLGVETTFTPIAGTLENPVPYNFYVGGAITPFPVELVSFNAKIYDNKVILDWNTATEVNNYGFEVQRSTKTDNWEAIGFIEGHGNSNSPKAYNYTDNKLGSSGTYYYRLKQIDNDGTYEYSKTLEVNFGVPITLELKQNYPNPFNPSTTISFTLPESEDVSLKIFSSIGEEIATLMNGHMEAGVYSLNFKADNLPSGFYIYQLKTNKNTLTKKMLFLK